MNPCNFVRRYCAPCHSKYGQEARQKKAYLSVKVDTDDLWKKYANVSIESIDRWYEQSHIMPPADAGAQPSDDERKMMLAWIDMGCPNTPDGQ